jgi:hypothetical protein
MKRSLAVLVAVEVSEIPEGATCSPSKNGAADVGDNSLGRPVACNFDRTFGVDGQGGKDDAPSFFGSSDRGARLIINAIR